MCLENFKDVFSNFSNNKYDLSKIRLDIIIGGGRECKLIW